MCSCYSIVGFFFDILKEPEWHCSNKNVKTYFFLMDAAAAASVPFASLQGMPDLKRPELAYILCQFIKRPELA